MGHSTSLLFVLILASLSVRADPPAIPGESAPLGRRLLELARKEARARSGEDSLWAEILDEYQDLITAHGDELVPLSSTHSLQIRRACAARLSRLPAAVLARHRQRLDASAQRWFEEGLQKRDARSFRRILDEAFCSQAAGSAIQLLGDLAFERGQFAEAELWWRLIAPPAGQRDDPQALLYPAADSLRAAARARQLLLRWIEGESARPGPWKQDLERFRLSHPTVEGYLAGERGLYWKTLRSFSERPHQPRESLPQEWLTFAGSSSRNLQLSSPSLTPAGIARLCRDGNHWTVPLPTSARNEDRQAQPPAEVARSLAYHPIILDHHALIADQDRIYAVDLRTGKRQTWCDASRWPGIDAEKRLPGPLDLRFTLTAGDDSIVTRLGDYSQRGETPGREPARNAVSYLVCLEREPQPGKEWLRWRLGSDTLAGRGQFEGAPVIVGTQAFVTVTRVEAGQTVTAIHCYPLRAQGAPAPRWKCDLCRTRDPNAGDARVRSHLLTVAGPYLLYCSHSGLVAAVEIDSGRLLWGARYRPVPVAEDPARPEFPRPLNPCVYSRGRVIVAPADSGLLLCLDVFTGRLLWERDGIEVIHLLGVGQDRVLFSTRTPRFGLRTISLRDGSDEGGWFRSGIEGPAHCFGRGLLAGDLVLWPTPRLVHVLRLEDGEQPDDPTLTHRLPPGNLAFGSGALVVTDRTRLHIFAPPIGK